MKTKRCWKCGKTRPIDEFYKNTSRYDNLQDKCILCNKERKKEYYHANKQECIEKSNIWKQSINGKFQTYQAGAKRRDLTFDLSKTELAEIISQPCYYCGKLQENFNGIDRVDNKVGYIKTNCVPCCGMCNRMKHAYNKEEFIMKCKAIVEKQEVMSYCQ